ncbi:MAG: prenyltransferase [Pseudomonadota bacterium]
MSFRVLLQSLRLPFLVLTPVCVLLGVATAAHSDAHLDPMLVLATLAAALFAHISVNTLNEYHDFTSGLDLHTQKTPFSGGSGALPAHPGMAPAVLATGLLSLGVVVLAGCYFLYLRGLVLLPAGMVGLLLVTTYTRWLNRSPWLCLVAPGLGFGPLMVAGTHFVLTGQITAQALSTALVPFFLVNNLLLLNQYPDIEADAGAGRRHVPIAFGTTTANTIYAVFLAAAAVDLLAATASGLLPATALLALLTLAPSCFAWVGALRHHGGIGRYPRYLAANVATAVLTPAVLAAVLIVAH